MSQSSMLAARAKVRAGAARREFEASGLCSSLRGALLLRFSHILHFTLLYCYISFLLPANISLSS